MSHQKCQLLMVTKPLSAFPTLFRQAVSPLLSTPPGTKMNISDGGFVACIPMPGGGKFSPHRLAAHRTNCGCHAHIRAQKILASKDSNEGTKTQPVVIDSDDELEIVMDVPANASTQTKDVPRAIKKEPRQTTVASSQTLNAKQNTATHLSPKQRAKMSADHSKTNPVEAPEKTADDIMSPETVGLSLANIVSRMSKGMLSTRQTDSGSSSESTTSESMPLSPSPSIPAVDTSLFSNPDKLVQMLKEIKRVRPFKRLRVTGRNLFQAAKTGNLEKVIALLVEGCQANNQVESEKGRTALHAAAAGGYLDILKVLRMVGGDVDVLDYDMRTPMFNAVEEHQIQAFEYLSKAGASLRAKDQGGMTLLHVAARRGHTDLISLLLNTGAFDINQKDDGGWTAIMWAAEDKHMATTKLLIDRGGSVHLRDLELNIPLHWAAYAGSEDISLLLLDAHSDVNAINKHGETPLHIATREDNFACVQLFMDRGARIDIANRNAMTPPEVALEGTKSQKLLEVNKMLRLCQPKARYRLLSCDISRGQENVAIPCVNEVDNEPCPDFHFVKESCEVGGSSIQWNIDTIESCSCEGDCRSGLMCQCANHSAHGKIWYTQDGLLSNEIHKLDRPLIFECNRLCKCWSYCRNRVVQKGVQYPLQLFKTKRKGWGVRALCPIPQGVFLCEYTGELISDTEADLRNDDTFLFDLDCKESDQELFCIDALRFGNISRFINHSCEPNCIPTRVFVNHQDIRFPRIAFFSSKDIEIYQEICFDYGDRFWEVKKDEFYCQCGTDSCNYRAPSV
ncbi:histone-lysine N-methyltransferase EHMT2 isoform X2 [Nematostella vectensis]|uniref:histone-lysine N-methyltransferase EHMT2 isoform X2 n=1 Tax=Nematostella vectensis TaxID=45351 RepID=UPI0020773109|nr:histone-lysine N-methyltransferase EHMT2 isoform X2 [Nematostella vectensis]